MQDSQHMSQFFLKYQGYKMLTHKMLFYCICTWNRFKCKNLIGQKLTDQAICHCICSNYGVNSLQYQLIMFIYLYIFELSIYVAAKLGA